MLVTVGACGTDSGVADTAGVETKLLPASLYARIFTE